MIRQISIRFDDDRSGPAFDVVDDTGRCAEGLTFDEMLGQIASMTFPLIDRSPLFRMRTAEDRDRERRERANRMQNGCNAKENVHG